MGINAEMERGQHDRRTVATEMTPKQRDEIHRASVSVAVQTEIGRSAKRKEISPWEERRTDNRKKPRQEELIYPEA